MPRFRNPTVSEVVRYHQASNENRKKLNDLVKNVHDILETMQPKDQFVALAVLRANIER